MVLQPLALFGISYLAALLAAVCLPPVALLLPAAFLTLAILLRAVQRKSVAAASIMLAGGAAAFLGLCIWQKAVLVPLERYEEQTGYAQVEVLERGDSGEDSLMSAVLRIKSWQGRETDFAVSIDQCPEMEVGECGAMQLVLHHPAQEDLLASYAKGAYLSAEYQGGYTYTGESRAWRARLYRFRVRLSGILRRYLSPESGPVAAAMAVGDRAWLKNDVHRMMSRAGISHLLVVSGLHVSLLCAALQQSRTGKYKRLRTVLAMGVAVFLMALTGFTPSVCRAGITAILCYTAVLCIRRPDALTNMAVAGLILCLPQPYRIADVSMQLSFAATLGMILSGTAQQRLFGQKKGGVKQRLAHMLQPLWSGFAASVCVVPVLLLHEMAVSGAGILGNLLTMWLVPYILLGSWCVILAGSVPLFYPIYRGASLVLELMLRLLRFAAQLCAALPFSRLPLPRGYTCLALAVLAALLWLAWYRRRWRWLAAALPVVLCVSLCIGAAFQKDTVELALVGNSASPCLIITQNAHTAVIFRGGTSNCRTVENYLDNHGIAKADYVLDLRLEAGRALPAAKHSMALTQAGAEQKQLWPGVWLQGIHTEKGNLAVVQIENWQMAMSTGSPALHQPILLDAYGAGTAVPQGIQAALVVTKSGKFEAESAAGAAVYQGGYSPRILLRPGRSLCYTGGTFYATE